jgi:DNA helicase-2/ATP-dependent DNA helicase PcrA
MEFLRRCAARRVGGPQPCGHEQFRHVAAAPTIAELGDEYLHLCTAADLRAIPAIEVGERLQPVLDAPPDDPSAIAREPLSSLLTPLDPALGLTVLAAASRERRDHTVLSDLRQLDADEGLTLEQFAGPELTLGKVALTTYHSAKGREFSVVILPGLVEGIVPRLVWSRRIGRFEEPARAVLAEERRTFYVALTRAEDAAVLIYGPGFETEWGAWNELGRSRFVVDVVERLNESEVL